MSLMKSKVWAFPYIFTLTFLEKLFIFIHSINGVKCWYTWESQQEHVCPMKITRKDHQRIYHSTPSGLWDLLARLPLECSPLFLCFYIFIIIHPFVSVGPTFECTTKNGRGFSLRFPRSKSIRIQAETKRGGEFSSTKNTNYVGIKDEVTKQR